MRSSPELAWGALLLDQDQTPGLVLGVPLVTLNNFERIARPRAGDVSLQAVPYQLSTVA